MSGEDEALSPLRPVLDLTQALLDESTSPQQSGGDVLESGGGRPAPTQPPQERRRQHAGKAVRGPMASDVAAGDSSGSEELTVDLFPVAEGEGPSTMIGADEAGGGEGDISPLPSSRQHLFAAPGRCVSPDADDRDSASAESPVSPGSPAPRLTDDGFPAAGDVEVQAAATRLWPFPALPPPSALPSPGVSRLAFHSNRYGAFVETYCGLAGATEVLRAQREARMTHVIGIRRVGGGRSGLQATVRATRGFLRHSVLAVEGDAVFCALMQRAEQLFAAEAVRATEAADTIRAALTRGETGEVEAKEDETAHCPSRKVPPRASAHLPRGVLLPSSLHRLNSKLPKLTDPLYRPNARCVCLHYGVPPSARGDGAEKDESGDGPARKPYECPVSLIVVLCSTRVEDGEEIYVSLDSYYRCLDEAAWHRQRYAPPAPARCDPMNPLVGGDIYTGVKRFLRWPRGLAYYHGVGGRHTSGDDQAVAGFPFTLVDLTVAPELGEGQLGVVAAHPVPYGTCFLYTGAAIAVKKVEELVANHNAVRGGDEEGSRGAPPVEEGEDNSDDAHAPHADKTKGRTKRAAGAGNGSKRGRARNKKSDDGSEETCERETAAAAESAGTVEHDTIKSDNVEVDDTYALGLGRHAMCFGQGIARYVNHRYNLSRYGNVELCSVMLPVPSEFSSLRPRSDAPSNSHQKRPVRRRQPRQEAKKSPPAGGKTENPPRAAVGRVAAAAAAQLAATCGAGSTSGGHEADAQPATMTTSATASLGDDAGGRVGGKSACKRRRPACRRPPLPHRRWPAVVLEEHSHFVTVPFFISTTDIVVGEPLLAWTYGEEYDAKLERVAVADGALVPHADAALLNCRPMMVAGDGDFLPRRGEAPPASEVYPHPSGGPPAVRLAPPAPSPRRWQRYDGDYRYALGPGDIVWRRLPAAAGGGAACEPPENNLFLVIQMTRDSGERALLLPLQRRQLPRQELRRLLKAQGLAKYVSPYAATGKGARGDRPTKVAIEEEEEERGEEEESEGESEGEGEGGDGPDEVQMILGARLYSRTPSAASSRVASATVTPVAQRRRWDDADGGAAATAPRRDPSLAWAVYDYTAPAKVASAHWQQQQLHRCVIATADTVGALQPDMDYVLLQGSEAVRGAAAAPAAGRNGHSPTTPRPRPSKRSLKSFCRLVVNLDDLHHHTALVRNSARAALVPPLVNGLLWPLLYPHRSSTATGSLWSNDTAGRPPTVV